MYPIDKLIIKSLYFQQVYLCVYFWPTNRYSFPFPQAYHLLQLGGEETGDIPVILPALRAFPTDEAASFHPMSMSKYVKN